MRNYGCLFLLIAAVHLITAASFSEARIQQGTARGALLVVVNQDDKNISLLDPTAGRQVIKQQSGVTKSRCRRTPM